MATRMQKYRQRMKERGLMQVTVWSKPSDTEKIRVFAQALLDGVDGPRGDGSQLGVQPNTSQASFLSVTGDDNSPDPGVGNATGDTDPDPSAQVEIDQDHGQTKPNTENVTGDHLAIKAAYQEVCSEVRNWEQEMADLSDRRRSREVLRELRLWLAELGKDEQHFKEAIEKVMVEQRDQQKQRRG